MSSRHYFSGILIAVLASSCSPEIKNLRGERTSAEANELIEISSSIELPATGLGLADAAMQIEIIEAYGKVLGYHEAPVLLERKGNSVSTKVPRKKAAELVVTSVKLSIDGALVILQPGQDVVIQDSVANFDGKRVNFKQRQMTASVAAKILKSEIAATIEVGTPAEICSDAQVRFDESAGLIEVSVMLGSKLSSIQESQQAIIGRSELQLAPWQLATVNQVSRAKWTIDPEILGAGQWKAELALVGMSGEKCALKVDIEVESEDAAASGEMGGENGSSNDQTGSGSTDPNGSGSTDPNGSGSTDPNGSGSTDPNGSESNSPSIRIAPLPSEDIDFGRQVYVTFEPSVTHEMFFSAVCSAGGQEIYSTTSNGKPGAFVQTVPLETMKWETMNDDGDFVLDGEGNPFVQTKLGDFLSHRFGNEVTKVISNAAESIAQIHFGLLVHGMEWEGRSEAIDAAKKMGYGVYLNEQIQELMADLRLLRPLAANPDEADEKRNKQINEAFQLLSRLLESSESASLSDLNTKLDALGIPGLKSFDEWKAKNPGEFVIQGSSLMFNGYVLATCRIDEVYPMRDPLNPVNAQVFETLGSIDRAKIIDMIPGDYQE